MATEIMRDSESNFKARILRAIWTRLFDISTLRIHDEYVYMHMLNNVELLSKNAEVVA